jgi:hypothetical protein
MSIVTKGSRLTPWVFFGGADVHLIKENSKYFYLEKKRQSIFYQPSDGEVQENGASAESQFS